MHKSLYSTQLHDRVARYLARHIVKEALFMKGKIPYKDITGKEINAVADEFIKEREWLTEGIRRLVVRAQTNK